jgi:NodT family efflux transporter outer membrane factor (OMF) lipoprotein
MIAGPVRRRPGGYGVLLVILAGAVLLAGCRTPPPVSAPAPPASALEPFLGAAGAEVVAAAVPARWWRLFDDPALDAEVERALAANTDLRAAVANLEAARAAAALAGVARSPATVIESGVGPERADRQPSTSSVPKTSYELGATIAWEVDLFGRLGAGVTAAQADAAASAALVDAARLAVAADTVAAYVDACAATAGLELARRQIAAQERSRSLVAERLAAGEVSPLELAQATTLRDRARAELPRYEADLQRSRYRLAVLQGRTPADGAAAAPACSVMPRPGAALPVGDASQLLARRPDLRAAGHRLAAATARIDVAVADLYPRVQLAASGGLIAGRADAILTPLITWSFPNRMAARARIESARGNASAALANWVGTLLRALAEVETALADLRAERQRLDALQAAVAAADDTTRRAQARFRIGSDDYLPVLDAERTRNDVELQRLLAEQRLAQVRVGLFRALGGGWEPDETVETGRQ